MPTYKVDAHLWRLQMACATGLFNSEPPAGCAVEQLGDVCSAHPDQGQPLGWGTCDVSSTMLAPTCLPQHRKTGSSASLLGPGGPEQV